jgi:hypothetical protein
MRDRPIPLGMMDSTTVKEVNSNWPVVFFCLSEEKEYNNMATDKMLTGIEAKAILFMVI